MTEPTFIVNLQENGTIILEIAEDITIFSFIVYGINSVDFISTHAQLQQLSLNGGNPLYCPYDFLKYFPSLTFLTMFNVGFDRIHFNSTSLTRLNLNYLTLPNVVTIQPSMLILPNLDGLELVQFELAKWFHVIPSSFVNSSISYLALTGVQHLYSYQFADVPLLKDLYFTDFFADFTLDENPLAGLDALEYLSIQNLPTSIDFIFKETFPNLGTISMGLTETTYLDQSFVERQKALEKLFVSANPFHCDCKMAWIKHASTNLGWSIYGTCTTPASLNGNSLRDSSNFLSCPNNQSYHCFNDTFICPQGVSCVNTANSAYCDCGAGYTIHPPPNACQDIDECSIAFNCEHNCTNTIGSYMCSCVPGYTLQPDLFSCVMSGVCQLTAQAVMVVLTMLLLITVVS